MFTTVSTALLEALHNLRSNYFRAFLSVLGIVIGVGALVTMLSLIDGLEAMAREQIAAKSQVEAIHLGRSEYDRVDGIQVPKTRRVRLTESLLDSLHAALPYAAHYQLYTARNQRVVLPDSGEVALRYRAISLPAVERLPSIGAGRSLTAADGDHSAPVVIVNRALARRLLNDAAAPPERALDRHLTLYGRALRVVGILAAEEDEGPVLEALLPLSTLSAMDAVPPYSLNAIVNLERLEEVLPARDFIEEWFIDRYPDIPNPVHAVARVDMVRDLEQGFLIFRLVMGFLIGIAVVVGGVGVMNVLLMSVTERTAEIGIRKAVGANRRRIVVQFLTESVTIATVGSVLGTLLGVAVAHLAAPLISHFSDGPEFRAVFSLQTLFVVGGLAVLVGVVFGTYPARQAANLDPVVAIQRG